MDRFLSLGEVEKLTGIKRNVIYLRVYRGRPVPFPIYKIDGMGLVAKRAEIEAWQKKIDALKPVGNVA